MKTSTHSSSTQAAVLAAAVLLCSTPGLLQAEETVNQTLERLDANAGPEGDGKSAAEVAAKFSAFAGSTENANALITGLRTGTAITLTATVNGQTTTTQFQPATSKLGYGNVFISLALAQKALAQAGITQPTPTQIVAALNGGNVTSGSGASTALAGVLALRSAGDGWGEIARSLGVKLGPIVSQMHAVSESIEHPVKPDMAGKPVLANHVTVSKPVVAVARPAWAGNPGVDHRPMMPPGQITRTGKP